MSRKISDKNYAALLAILSSVGLVAAFWQTAEKIHFLKNPDIALSCNLNPIVDCGTVLNHELSAVFGVPNSMIGMVAFAVLAAIGLLMLLGVKINQASKNLTLGLATVMMAFSIWFFFVSLYDIGKICIFCVAIWAATIPLFGLTVKQYGKDLLKKQSFSRWLYHYFDKYPERLIVVLYVAAIMTFLFRFRDYYFG